MSKYLKGELIKFIANRYWLFCYAVIILYSALAHYLYLSDGVALMIMYDSFIEEYYLLYVILSLFFTSTLIADEYHLGTIAYLKNNKFLVSKLIIMITFVVVVFLVSLIISLNVSAFFLKPGDVTVEILIKVINDFIYIFPYLLFLNLCCVFFSVLFKKSNISLGISIIFYWLLEYIKSVILSKRWQMGYYFISLNWKVHDIELIPKYLGIISSIVQIIIVIILIFYIFNKQKID